MAGIDFGTNPQGTPATPEQKQGIRDSLDVQTVSEADARYPTETIDAALAI